MLKRKAEKVLLDWMESKDALLITGARQVGKSYLVREFLKDKFDHFLEINLYDHKEWIPVLEQAKNADDLLFRLTAFSEEDLSEGSTLVFFDEIQYAKHSVGVITALCPYLGYKKSAELAKEALKKNIRIKDLILEYGLIGKEELEKILDPYAMT